MIKKIAVDPSTSDGVPRLAVDVALGSDTQPYGANRGVVDTTPPPTRLPPAFGHPLPSVLVSPGLARDVRQAEERPPRRRVHSTAEISRRPGSEWAAWSAPPIVISRPRRRARAAQDTLADATAYASELLGAVRVLQAFTNEALAKSRFGAAVERAFVAARDSIRARAILTAFAIFLVFASVVVSLMNE